VPFQQFRGPFCNTLPDDSSSYRRGLMGEGCRLAAAHRVQGALRQTVCAPCPVMGVGRPITAPDLVTAVGWQIAIALQMPRFRESADLMKTWRIIILCMTATLLLKADDVGDRSGVIVITRKKVQSPQCHCRYSDRVWRKAGCYRWHQCHRENN
jgi:hypothetical protein